ncbi:MAG: sodium-dependent transporter, partial [Lachnospiraceae bacterium]|nr:sodium-dependent transporter [Lachnospiraceae bacterium]
NTILGAMSQLFYSLSLAMGIMITYGSYMKKENNIQTSAHQIILCDSFVAILAGLIIIPAVFAYGNPSTDLKAGPSLMFIIIPKLFAAMPFGRVIAIMFFFLVFFAALTSSISLYETVVSNITDAFKIKRNESIIYTLLICVIIGGLSSLGYGPLGAVTLLGMQFLDFFDFISNSVLMPIVALFTCFFVGYVLKPKAIIEEVEQHKAKFTWKGLFTVVIKYIAPIIIIIILVVSIFQAMGKISI